MPKTAKPSTDVYQIVTDAIVAKLEQGIVPWQKPWTSDENRPTNLISKKPYKGINVFLLGMQSYGSPYWLTFKQAAELGYRSWLKDNKLKDSKDNEKAYQALAICEPGEDFDPAKHKRGVIKGQKSTLITFWKIMQGKDADTGERKSFPLLRHYNVFNVEQTQGLNLPQAEEVTEREPVDAIEAGEAIVKGYATCPPIKHGGGRAFYMPTQDYVQMPERDDFKTSEGYYSTLFHELIHSTGHSSRLNRPELTKMVSFGDEEYSKEELTAEMGAAMLCATAGIEPDYNNNAAYIGSWLKKLRDDKKLLIGAAGKAQKAADYILGTTQDDKTEAAA